MLFNRVNGKCQVSLAIAVEVADRVTAETLVGTARYVDYENDIRLSSLNKVRIANAVTIEVFEFHTGDDIVNMITNVEIQ